MNRYLVIPIMLTLGEAVVATTTVFVSSDGHDLNPGTQDAPFASVYRAIQEPVQDLHFVSGDVIYENVKNVSGNVHGNQAVIVGGRKIADDDWYIRSPSHPWKEWNQWLNQGELPSGFSQDGSNLVSGDAVGRGFASQQEVLVGMNCAYMSDNSRLLMSNIGTTGNVRLVIYARRIAGAGSLFLSLRETGISDEWLMNPGLDTTVWSTDRTDISLPGFLLDDTWQEFVIEFSHHPAGVENKLQIIIGTPAGTEVLLNRASIYQSSRWEQEAGDVYRYAMAMDDSALVNGVFKVASYEPDNIRKPTAVRRSANLTGIAPGEYFVTSLLPYLYYRLDRSEESNIAEVKLFTANPEAGAAWLVDTGDSVNFVNAPGQTNLFLRMGHSGLWVQGSGHVTGGGVDGNGWFAGLKTQDQAEVFLTNAGNVFSDNLAYDYAEVGAAKGSGVLASGSSNVVIHGLHVSRNTDDGLQALKSANLRVVSFIAIDNEGSGIEPADSSGLQEYYNGIVHQKLAPAACIIDANSPSGIRIYKNVITIADTDRNAFILDDVNGTIIGSHNYPVGLGPRAELIANPDYLTDKIVNTKGLIDWTTELDATTYTPLAGGEADGTGINWWTSEGTDAPLDINGNPFPEFSVNPGAFAEVTGTGAPVARDDFYVVAKNAIATPLDSTSNDFDFFDPVTVSVLSNPEHGGLVTATGTPGPRATIFFQYTPPSGFAGIETFTYQITDTNGATDDALVTISVEITDDEDQDGVTNSLDNCVLVANGSNDIATAGPSQNDTDSDDYGNMCDADFNNNGVVDSNDASVLFGAFGKNSGDPSFNPAVDLNGNGVIDSNDASILFGSFGSPPGPSGLIP